MLQLLEHFELLDYQVVRGTTKGANLLPSKPSFFDLLDRNDLAGVDVSREKNLSLTALTDFFDLLVLVDLPSLLRNLTLVDAD